MKICVGKELIGEIKHDQDRDYWYVAVTPDLREGASNLINGTPSDGVVGKKENFLHISVIQSVCL